MSHSLIPVTIVTGFLGAGKSTLLQSWLCELPRDETAVIVNERGEVGIDGELLSAHVARLREITGGCVCCSSHLELVSALAELGSASPRPSRILVETSGAASPAGVIRALSAPRMGEHLRLDGVVTVLDATRVKQALEFDLAAEQLGFADVVVLSHVDSVGGAEAAAHLSATEDIVRRHAPAAFIARSSRGRIDATFLELLAQRVETLHLYREGSGHSVIESVALVLDSELDEERFSDWVEDALGSVEARILRIKGILAMDGVDSRVIMQGVSEAVDIQLGTAWGDAPRCSRLVVLGLGLNAAELEAGFLRCAATPAP